jgi:hypothetical protein
VVFLSVLVNEQAIIGQDGWFIFVQNSKIFAPRRALM